MRNDTRNTLIPAQFLAVDERHAATETERAILGYLFQSGPGTQAELASSLPYSQQTISRISVTLEGRGLLERRSGETRGRRGQPSSLLQINGSYAYSFGLSLMSDGYSLSLTNFEGRVVGYVKRALPKITQKTLAKSVRESMKQLIKEGGVDKSRVFGLGVSVTGFRAGERGSFNTPSSLDDFALIDLEVHFAKAFNLPVWAENDGKAATVAELMTGAGRNITDFCYMHFATGIGGGLVIDGKLVPGVRGNAGEFAGILPLDLFEQRPTLELLREYLNAHGENIGSVVELVHDYDDTWKGIDEWITATAPAFSLMVSAASAVLDTGAIILGGLMPRALAKRLIPSVEFFDIGRRSVERQAPTLIPGECAGDAAAIGASLLPFVDTHFNGIYRQ